MVAKSFQTFIMLSEPFEQNKKMYIKVQNPKTKTERTVRWYSEQEYRKMYPETPAAETDINDSEIPNSRRKYALGFNLGYITIFRGDADKNIDWIHSIKARFARPWGWYIISTQDLPTDIPDDIELVRLEWDKIVDENNNLIAENDIKDYVEQLLYGTSSNSDYVGEVGERIEFEAFVKSVELTEHYYYGKNAFYTFIDTNGNQFTWKTSSNLTIEEDSTITIKGTVKEHIIERGIKTTNLTRCKVI